MRKESKAGLTAPFLALNTELQACSPAGPDPDARFFQSALFCPKRLKQREALRQETAPAECPPLPNMGGRKRGGGRGGGGCCRCAHAQTPTWDPPEAPRGFLREGAVRRLGAHAQRSCRLTCHGDRLRAAGQGFLRADDLRSRVAHPWSRDGAGEELESPSGSGEHGRRVRPAGRPPRLAVSEGQSFPSTRSSAGQKLCWLGATAGC